jgi:hypothetical protein
MPFRERMKVRSNVLGLIGRHPQSPQVLDVLRPPGNELHGDQVTAADGDDRDPAESADDDRSPPPSVR